VKRDVLFCLPQALQSYHLLSDAYAAERESLQESKSTLIKLDPEITAQPKGENILQTLHK